MPLYRYKVTNKLGDKTKGDIYAETIDEARSTLEGREMIVIDLKKRSTKTPFWKKSYGTVSFKEKKIFLKYLSSILDSGLGINRGLGILTEQIKKKYFKHILEKINEEVEHGQSFHESLHKFPKVFSPVFVNMISVGEVSGTLPKTLEYLEDVITKDHNLRQRVQSALTYPIIILVLVVLVTLGLIKFIVPRITQIFVSFDVDLPAPTQFLINTEKFLSAYGWYLLAGFGLLFTGFVFVYRIRKVKKVFHSFFLRIPVIGSINKQVQITRFNQITSSLVQSGITLVESLNITAETLKNRVYRDYVKEAANYMKSGGELSEYLSQRPDLFEPIVTQMIKLGESTGSIDENMQILAELNEAEVTGKIKGLSGLIGPIMLILMGVLIGGIAISIISPIYQLPTLIQR